MIRAIVAATVVVLLAATPAMAQTASTPTDQLELVAQGGARQVLTRDSLARLPQEEVRGRIHGGPELVFRGPAVATVLALSGTATDRVRGKSLRLAVVAQARDDYAVTYSLGELSPGLSGRRMIVALTQDGAPLGEDDGPLRIVVEGDLHPSRWIRQLSRLSLVEVRAP
jgi:hypothetical protein